MGLKWPKWSSTLKKSKKIKFEFRTLSGVGPYLFGPTGQLVDFLGSEFQKYGSCHIVFFIKEGTNKYLKVTDVDGDESRSFLVFEQISDLSYFLVEKSR